VAARTDGLTQLPNHIVLLHGIEQAIARGIAQPGYQFAVLFMDYATARPNASHSGFATPCSKESTWA
jgi:PleD family two-component response regulator